MFLPVHTTKPPKSKLPRGCTFSELDWKILAAFWHPVALAADVAAGPVAARLLDVGLVLWRTSKGFHAAKDLCMHRGGQLSRGSVRDGLLVCPLHGFHYDGAGVCRKIPALAAGNPIPSRMRLESYPCTERYGLVWVCFADTARAPLPEWADIESGSGTLAMVPPSVWHASAARHVENFNDLAHIPFVHQSTFGGDEDKTIAPYQVSIDGLTLQFQADYHEQARFIEKSETEQSPLLHRRYLYHLTLPFTCYLRVVDVARGTTYRVYDVASPTSAMQSRIFQLLYDETGNNTPAKMIDFQTRINSEDLPQVEAQSPLELPLDLRDEIHIPADRMSIEYRRALAKLGLGAELILGEGSRAGY
jgi:phenylpropionate dioxygenase-like ring-hydroxylating dioxygenase large terminal subunit